VAGIVFSTYIDVAGIQGQELSDQAGPSQEVEALLVAIFVNFGD
jgi:hypothetical protein